MRFFSVILFLCLAIQTGFSQIRNVYKISFDNVVHHEATVTAVFTNLQQGTVSLQMSRTSPGRYALHEFAKNIYNVQITDGKGKSVNVSRPNLHQWDVNGHDGTVQVSYTLFGDRGDGTYTLIDDNLAIINNPATFMYIESLKERPVQVTYELQEGSNWKVATQLAQQEVEEEGEGEANVFLAPNLDYFMDSPALLGNHTVKEHKVENQGDEYTIKMALQHQGTEEEADQFFEQIKKIVEEQRKVFGDYPTFENKEYTFLAAFMPEVSNDGMEHRNSTVITKTKSLADGGMQDNISVFAHEFFHSWNVERIRPQSLEPFKYDEANSSEELWFAEGFTSYYGHLSLCRAGIIDQEEYFKRITKVYNKVWASPALNYYNVKQISAKAPFVDAAKSVAPVNFGNTYVSYYDYGHMLALALDLSLRNEKGDLNLDDFMKLFWTKYGKTEIPYTVDNLFITLREYAGSSFADNFFGDYINKSKVPGFKKLFAAMAIDMKPDPQPYIGGKIEFTKNGLAVISEYTKQGTPLYEIGIEKGDVIFAIGNRSFSSIKQFNEVVGKNKIGKKVLVQYKRDGKDRSGFVEVRKNPNVVLGEITKKNEKGLARRKLWLESRE